jgi:peptide/nickel transport system ATP-binding protein
MPSSFPPGQIIEQALKDVIRYYNLVHDSFEMERLIRKKLNPLGLNPEMLKRYPHQLSGGEMQRMALARIKLVNQ